MILGSSPSTSERGTQSPPSRAESEPGRAARCVRARRGIFLTRLERRSRLEENDLMDSHRPNPVHRRGDSGPTVAEIRRKLAILGLLPDASGRPERPRGRDLRRRVRPGGPALPAAAWPQRRRPGRHRDLRRAGGGALAARRPRPVPPGQPPAARRRRGRAAAAPARPRVRLRAGRRHLRARHRPRAARAAAQPRRQRRRHLRARHVQGPRPADPHRRRRARAQPARDRGAGPLRAEARRQGRHHRPRARGAGPRQRRERPDGVGRSWRTSPPAWRAG